MRWDAASEQMEKYYKADDPSDWSGVSWAGNATDPPTGVPQCGWEGELCESDENNTEVYIVLVVILSISIGVVALLFWQYR